LFESLHETGFDSLSVSPARVWLPAYRNGAEMHSLHRVRVEFLATVPMKITVRHATP
jgi:hypothetical protein